MHNFPPRIPKSSTVESPLEAPEASKEIAHRNSFSLKLIRCKGQLATGHRVWIAEGSRGLVLNKQREPRRYR